MESKQRVLLITGATGGIGAAVAERAAAAGYSVAVHYHGAASKADSLCRSIRERGGVAEPFQADVGAEAEVVRMFTDVAGRLGRVAGLVNNAGIVAPLARVDEMSGERLERMFRTNVVGAFLCVREAIKQMSPRHGGAGGVVVNVSSVAAKFGSPNDFVDYAASKGAIDTLTVGLAKEVADEGIRVNAVRPGLIDTGIHAHTGAPNRAHDLSDAIPLKRPGQPDEVAAAILWLLSDEASYVTGSILDVGGGR